MFVYFLFGVLDNHLLCLNPLQYNSIFKYIKNLCKTFDELLSRNANVKLLYMV